MHFDGDFSDKFSKNVILGLSKFSAYPSGPSLNWAQHVRIIEDAMYFKVLDFKVLLLNMLDSLVFYIFCCVFSKQYNARIALQFSHLIKLDF